MNNGTLFGPDMERDAWISDCGKFRYSLSRAWDADLLKPWLGVIMLNPSRADALVDDPTIIRCIGFAHRLGFAGLTVRNLFAFRATNPDEMFAAPDPIGPENDAAILNLVGVCPMVIAAWGVHGSHIGRDKAVVKLLAEGLDSQRCWIASGSRKTDTLRHPLYLPSNVEVVSYGC